MNKKYATQEEKINKLVNDFKQPSTRKLVESWVNERTANGRSIKDTIVLMYTLYQSLNTLKKPIKKIIADEDKDIIAKHLKNIAINGKVIRKHKKIIKRFFKWVNGDEHPKCTKWIDTKKTLSDMKPEIKLLTDEEKKAILDNAPSQRDRTVFSILMENPTRPRDIINLSIKDVTPNQYGYELKFHSKTQRGFRTVQFIHSVPEIRLYLTTHQWRDDPAAPLFYSYSNRDKDNKPHRLEYYGLMLALKESCRRAGIKRDITLYHFRKTVTSELLQDPRFTSKEIQVLGGWANISTMFDTYGKVTSEMVNKKKLMINGKIKDDKKLKESVLKPINCPRCKTENPRNVDSCIKCWLPLTKKSIQKIDKTMNKAMKNETIKDQIKKDMIEEIKAELRAELGIKPK